MKGFILGVIVGAMGTMAALLYSRREEIFDIIDRKYPTVDADYTGGKEYQSFSENYED